MSSFVDKHKKFLDEEQDIFGGKQYLFKFPNGYGASVVMHMYSYGVEHGLWELAVIKYDSFGEWNLCYSTDITDDAIGDLTEEDVSSLLGRIKDLVENSERGDNAAA